MSETDNCEEVLAEIELFLDRELPGAQWEQIRVHIETCTPCGERAEFRRRLRVIIASKCGSEAVPHSLLDRIRATLAEEHGYRPAGPPPSA